MLRNRIQLLCLSVCCHLTTIGLASPAFAGDWPTFRGLDRSGVSQDKDLLAKWPEAGPPLIWQAKGAGRGYSSLAIKSGKIYTLGDAPSIAEDKDEYVVCFNEKDGTPIWKAKVGTPWTSGKPDWQSSRGTPSVNDDYCYVVSPEGALVCLKVSSGEEVWRKHLINDLGGKKGDGWGYSESPLLDGELVICTPGGDKATMVALNGKTGDVIWTTVQEGNRGAGHASPVISHVNGIKVYVQSTASGAMGVRASDGKLLWTYGIDLTTAVIPTPIVKDDYVFFTAGYKRGGALLKQVPGKEEGTVDMQEIYPLVVKLANKHGGVVLVGDYLYGDSDDQGTPFCADLMTGEIKWQSRGSGKGSAAFAAADGHLYIRFSNGVTVLANADPSAYTEVSSFIPPGSGERPSWSHPVILDGKLYLRDQDTITCYDVKRK